MTRDQERFAAVFRENVRRRSRSARGKNVQGMGNKKSETTRKKKPLLLEGEALKARVAENVERLIGDVLETGIDVQFDKSGRGLRKACERWFDIAGDGLCDPDGYREELAELETGARRLERATGEAFPLNPRYRLWTPEYTTLRVPPIMLERFMDGFYEELSRRVSASVTRRPGPIAHTGGARLQVQVPTRESRAARLLAYADLMMDGELHPWLDGCSRISTALVMCISRFLKTEPPLFAETKKAHYATIRDIDAHAAYYVECFERSRAFAVAS